MSRLRVAYRMSKEKRHSAEKSKVAYRTMKAVNIQYACTVQVSFYSCQYCFELLKGGGRSWRKPTGEHHIRHLRF